MGQAEGRSLEPQQRENLPQPLSELGVPFKGPGLGLIEELFLANPQELQVFFLRMENNHMSRQLITHSSGTMSCFKTVKLVLAEFAEKHPSD